MDMDDIKKLQISQIFLFDAILFHFFSGFDLVESFEEFDQYSKKLAHKQIQKNL